MLVSNRGDNEKTLWFLKEIETIRCSLVLNLGHGVKRGYTTRCSGEFVSLVHIGTTLAAWPSRLTHTSQCNM